MADLAAAPALGGDCLADIAVLRAPPELAGPVASDPVVFWLVKMLAEDGPRAISNPGRGSGPGRWPAMLRRARGGGLVTIDRDATIVIAYSEKEQTFPTWKTFGHHLMTAWADYGEEGNGEPLVILLRPGNAGSNAAVDHIGTARREIARLPGHLRRGVLVRADSRGATWVPPRLTAEAKVSLRRTIRGGPRPGPQVCAAAANEVRLACARPPERTQCRSGSIALTTADENCMFATQTVCAAN